MKTTRCTVCSTEFSDVEIEEAKCCPECGATNLPCAINQDLTIKINWHELRILTNWANFWAIETKINRSGLDAILKRLEAQRPEGFAPLTVFGEAKKIQSESDRLFNAVASLKPN